MNDPAEQQNQLYPVLQRLNRPAAGGHRGGRSSFGPENTLYSYRKCVNEAQMDVLEIDIQITKDNHLILHHDGTVVTTTNGSGSISTMTLQQLRELDAAYHFTPDGGKTYPLRGKGITIPTLNEVLDEFVPVERLNFFFDMKSARAIPATLKVIEERNIAHRVIFGAVSPTINTELLKQKPANIPIAADVQSMLDIYAAYRSGTLDSYRFQHDILGFIVDSSTKDLLSKQLFDVLHSKGKRIAVFGESLDDPQMQHKMIDFNTDLIFTDRPDVLRQTFRDCGINL